MTALACTWVRTASQPAWLAPSSPAVWGAPGIDRGKLEILGDVVAPSDAEWEAGTDPDRVLNP